MEKLIGKVKKTGPYRCSHTGCYRVEPFDKKSNWIRHMSNAKHHCTNDCPLEHGKITKFNCDICGFYLATKQKLDQHKSKKHATNQNQEPPSSMEPMIDIGRLSECLDGILSDAKVRELNEHSPGLDIKTIHEKVLLLKKKKR
ncbi:hypothetical protein ACTA71_003381 [Dictyostelium dimigraforme]